MKPKVQQTTKRMSFELSLRDSRKLMVYDKSKGITRPEAVKRIVRNFLANEVADQPDTAKNQLGLFD